VYIANVIGATAAVLCANSYGKHGTVSQIPILHAGTQTPRHACGSLKGNKPKNACMAGDLPQKIAI
jgi:hypothetical protein